MTYFTSWCMTKSINKYMHIDHTFMYFLCGFTCDYVFNEDNSMISGEKTVVLKDEFVSDLVISINYILNLKYAISFWVFQMILKYMHT